MKAKRLDLIHRAFFLSPEKQLQKLKKHKNPLYILRKDGKRHHSIV